MESLYWIVFLGKCMGKKNEISCQGSIELLKPF